MTTQRNAVVSAATSLLVLTLASGCAGTLDPHPTNAELYDVYAARAGEGPVLGTPVEATGDTQVSAEVVAHIDRTLGESYHRDVERCAEEEMERLDNRYLGGELVFELHVGSDGKVHKAGVLEGDLRERRDASGRSLEGPGRVADRFHACFADTAKTWEFSQAPESSYVHTYAVTLGEAW